MKRAKGIRHYQRLAKDYTSVGNWDNPQVVMIKPSCCPAPWPALLRHLDKLQKMVRMDMISDMISCHVSSCSSFLLLVVSFFVWLFAPRIIHLHLPNNNKKNNHNHNHNYNHNHLPTTQPTNHILSHLRFNSPAPSPALLPPAAHTARLPAAAGPWWPTSRDRWRAWVVTRGDHQVILTWEAPKNDPKTRF